MSTNHSQTTKLSIDVLDEDEAIAPSEQKARIDGYDLARCLAFFGMVVVNYRYVMGGMSGTPDWLLSAMDVVTLRAAATFVMLAGVSMTLFWRARRGSEGPGRLSSVIRALALVVVFAGAWVAFGGQNSEDPPDARRVCRMWLLWTGVAARAGGGGGGGVRGDGRAGGDRREASGRRGGVLHDPAAGRPREADRGGAAAAAEGQPGAGGGAGARVAGAPSNHRHLLCLGLLVSGLGTLVLESILLLGLRLSMRAGFDQNG